MEAKAHRALSEKEFVAEKTNRSESEGGTYVAFVQKAVRHYSIFQNFRRHPAYQEVLEHVTKEEGSKYLEIFESQTPELLKYVDAFKENDLVGSPATHSYQSTGNISPTTVRYMKVASDIKKIFGNNVGEKIVEVGVGYGGQLLIIDKVFSFKECHLYDLPPVLALVAKFLESFILNCSYKLVTLNQCAGTETYDFLMSNYAFSELPSQLQRMYIKKVISKSRKGYMTMNSGKADSIFNKNHLSIAELRELLPPFEIIPEHPLTAPHNYVIIWGHQDEGIQVKPSGQEPA